MANVTISMNKIRQILRLYNQGRSKQSIAIQTGVWRNTAKKYLAFFQSSGFTFEEVNSLGDRELEELFGKSNERKPDSRLQALQRCFPRIDRELKRTGVTRKMLWEGYREEFPQGLQYTQFCFYYNQWKAVVNPVMHLDHKAGDKVYIDFAGKKLQVTDKDSGEIREVEVFVAVLGASQLTYVEAVEGQGKEDLIGACENALHYFGGVPSAIVPDNLKAAVTRSNRYEPTLNETFADFADHHQTSVLPARAYRPRDKALVEGAVKIIYGRIYAPLGKNTYHSLSELNAAIREHLEGHNNGPLRGRNYSRRLQFEQVEREALGYRNITFMLQKSLARTNYIDIYQQFKDKFLVNDTCKWFVDKRNEVLKQQPFDLEKKVIITVYTGKTSLALVEKIFTVENDIEFSTIIDSLRIFLVNINPIEVFFSAEFSFYEKGQSKELYESLISGINHMKLFVTAVKGAINEECTLCDQLEQKINSMNFYRVPKNMLFVDDYVYNCQKDLFEKGSRIELTLESPPQRIPIDRLSNMASNGKEKDPFYNFVLMHIVLFKMQKKLMPTCMIIYNDDTFEFKSFDSSIKTTTYRKFNEIAQLIERNKIVKVFYVTELLVYSKDSPNYNDLLKMSSKDRTNHKTSEMLGFFMLDRYLSFKAFYFNLEKIDDMTHIMTV